MSLLLYLRIYIIIGNKLIHINLHTLQKHIFIVIYIVAIF